MKNSIILYAVILFILLAIPKIYAQPGWVSQDIGTNDFVAISFINQNTGYIFCIDGWIYKTTNKGQNWVQSMKYNFQGVTNPVVHGIAITDSIFMLTAAQAYAGGEIYITQNCHTWFYANIVPPQSGFNRFKRLCKINYNVVYACGLQYGSTDLIWFDKVVYKTTNTGAYWIESYRSVGGLCDIRFKDINTGYALGDGSILKTTNGGNSWDYLYGFQTFTLGMSNLNNDTFIVFNKDGKLSVTFNSGNNFVFSQTQSGDTLRNGYFLNGKTGWVVGDSGYILKTTNAGINFTKQNSNTTFDLLDIHFIDSNTGIICGKNGKILRTTNGGVTNIEKSNEETPTEYDLFQNYPNPFNPVTRINFALPKQGFVTLKIYDITGREVKVLLNEFRRAGYYTVDFNGSNFASGVYFYRIQSGNFISVKKMVLIK
jgi:photosystem II stability/assembly factor-like uncharacterized protein